MPDLLVLRPSSPTALNQEGPKVQLLASAFPRGAEEDWQVIPLKPITDPLTHWLIWAVFVLAHR